MDTGTNGHAFGEALGRLRRIGRQLGLGGVEPGRAAELEFALAQMEALLRPAGPAADGHGLPAGHLLTDALGVILEADQAAAELLGIRREFLLDKPFPLFLVEAHRSALYALLGRSLPSEVRDWRVRLRARRGEPVAAALSLALRQEAGGPPRLRWLLRPAGPEAYHAMQVERLFSDTLLDAANAMALVLDDRGLIQRHNPYAGTASGRGDGELLGQEWAGVLLGPGDRAAAREVAGRAANQNVVGGFTAILPGRDLAPRTVAWSLMPLHRPEGRGAFVLAMGHDITELQEAQRLALDAGRLAAIGQVTATMAHESRNLLQSISACLERLAWRLEGQPEALDLVRRAQQAQRGLTLLFDDIRSYAAPLRLALAECDLARLWREVWDGVRAEFPGREAALSESGEPPPWRADRFRLAQVFRNLFENSFNACAAGEAVRVEVAAALQERAGRPGVRVAVRDHGPGLNAEQRRRLFEPFFTTRPEGTGLGMTIAKRILEAHGGDLALGDATPGLEIILWLPREVP